MGTACIKKPAPVGLTLAALPLLISIAYAEPPEAEKYVSIERHVNSRYITASVKGLGGHSGNCIEFNLRNTRADTLFVRIEPGRRLVSKDTTLQDIFIVKESRFALLPYEKRTVTGYGFCCESSMHSPSTNAVFTIGYMAPESWVRLADTINKYQFESHDIQSAVWVLSNGHCISSIGDKDMVLKKTVAAIKGVEVPWYSTSYARDTARLFSGEADTLRANIPYFLKTSAVVSVTVRNKKGQLMAVPLRGGTQHPGEYTFNLAVSVKNWPKGEYEVFIYEDEYNLNLKKSFKL